MHYHANTTGLADLADNRENIVIRKEQYDKESILVVDFGPTVQELSLDIVDDTAIVITDGKQFEFEVPTDADDVTVNDGILTIKQDIKE
jgi:hypothetical protein